MGGRFVQKSPEAEIEFSFLKRNPLPNVQQRFNAAPSQEIAVVRQHPDTSERSVDLLVWGLVPEDRLEDDQRPGRDGEDQRLLPSGLRGAALHRTCRRLLRVTGEKGFRQPHAIAMADRHLFGFAGLWEGWKDPATEQWLRTVNIITTKANALGPPGRCRYTRERQPGHQKRRRAGYEKGPELPARPR